MIFIKETSKSGVIANINGVYGKVSQEGQFVPYTEKELSKKTAFKDTSGWVEYESLNDWVKIYQDKKTLKKLEIQKRKEKMEAIQENPQNYTALEIYECALYLHKKMKGWEGADLLLSNTAFKKLIINKLGSYTVTPYDDGTLLIKANGKRYGNKRGWLDIKSLLN